jgi:anti-sigma factor RsiW
MDRTTRPLKEVLSVECEVAKLLIHPYVDGELDAGHVLEVDQHVAGCAACAQAVERVRAVGSAVSGAGLRFSAPESLRERIEAELRPRPVAVASTDGSQSPRWKYLALAASLLAASLLGFQLTRGTHRSDLVIAEVVDAHVRSLMADHLLDVASSDKHTVRPWFTGKIDFSPTVVDLKEHGYPLLGGRLDMLGSEPAAALVYQHGKHTINVFIRPEGKIVTVGPVGGAPGSGAEQVVSLQGFNVASWSERGFDYHAVSDVSSDELKNLVALLRSSPFPAAGGNK